MENSRVYDDTVLLKNEIISSSSDALDSLTWLPNSSPSFHGSASMVNFEGENNTEMPFVTENSTKVETINEDFDGCFHQPEKKRRLLPDQVHFLEKSFEMENKLEPERKLRLAKQLGLQPRQVTIWFQNRRARSRTKLLEKEYDSLKASFDKLQQDCDAMTQDNVKLKNEVEFLTRKLFDKENDGKNSKQEPSETNAPLDLLQPKKQISASSAKSDVFDSDSPHYADGALLEPADSSRVIETEASDFSQDEDDSLSKSLLRAPYFPKLELECYDDLQPNSCNFGFPVQDQGTWIWQY